MNEDVRREWWSFNVRYEGYTNFMYLDIRRLVTTGVGNLIDPLPEAKRLPWLRADGSAASDVEIEAAWNKVKNDRTLTLNAGGAQYAKLTSLRLSEGTVRSFVAQKLLSNHAELSKRFAAIDTWPADAIMAVNSMAWAMGPAGFAKFPKCSKSLMSQDFLAASKECRVSPDVGSLKDRNNADVALFETAAKVVSSGLPRGVLYGVKGGKAKEEATCPTCGKAV